MSMSRMTRYALLNAAVRAAEVWHGAHTGGDDEDDHQRLTDLMRKALNMEFQGKVLVAVQPNPDIIELINMFYPPDEENER